MTLRSIAAVIVAAAAVVVPLPGQTPSYQPAPENLKARQWFQDARFGLFVHWGIYSLMSDGEWVRLAKDAGMKYITITSKHHDGFAMFDSKVSDWDIVDRSPYAKDVLKPLAEATKRHGLKLFFYYSQLDWHHPDYFPLGRTGRDAGRRDGGTWPQYLDYMDAQLAELLTNYGEIGGIWFDGWWDRPDADWRLPRTYGLIHRLQPAALVGANHHRAPFPGEDFQMFEKDLPGHNTAGFNADSQIGTLPLETCDTINGAWGFNINDRRYKSTRELVHYLARAAGYNANFLLNVGPMPDGRIQPEFVTRLREIGGWLKTNGASIYGTRGGPIPPRSWGATTRRDDKIYVHVLEWPDATLLVPPLGRRVRAARFLRDGSRAEFVENELGVLLKVPENTRDPYDTVVELQLEPGGATPPPGS